MDSTLMFTVPTNYQEACDLIRASRQGAYQSEADPMFFQVYRGEIDRQAYLDKIEEIKERFPYPNKADWAEPEIVPVPAAVPEPAE